MGAGIIIEAYVPLPPGGRTKEEAEALVGKPVMVEGKQRGEVLSAELASNPWGYNAAKCRLAVEPSLATAFEPRSIGDFSIAFRRRTGR